MWLIDQLVQCFTRGLVCMITLKHDKHLVFMVKNIQNLDLLVLKILYSFC